MLVLIVAYLKESSSCLSELTSAKRGDWRSWPGVTQLFAFGTEESLSEELRIELFGERTAELPHSRLTTIVSLGTLEVVNKVHRFAK